MWNKKFVHNTCILLEALSMYLYVVNYCVVSQWSVQLPTIHHKLYMYTTHKHHTHARRIYSSDSE